MEHREETLAEAVSQAEAQVFVGRAQELEALRQATVAAQRQPQVVYVFGPPGVGKSALLRAHRRELAEQGRAVVALDGWAVGPSRADLGRSLAEQLGLRPPPAANPEVGALVRAARRLAGRRGLSLLFDTYEELIRDDRWLRTQVLYGLGPGTCLVLAGKLAPEALWAEDPPFLALLRRLPLADLREGEAREYLRRRGIADPDATRQLYALTGGQPLLLALAASLARSEGAPEAASAPPWAGPGGMVRLTGSLVEHLVGRAGRPGLGEAVRAASLVRTFDLPLLSAMIGPLAAEAAWPELVALPVVRPAGERCTVHEAVRSALGEALAREAPWKDRRWRRRAMAHYLEGVRRDPRAEGSLAWRELSHLAQGAPWRSFLEPRRDHPQPWRFTRGVQPEDRDALVACRRSALAAHFLVDAEGLRLAEAALDRLLEACPDCFILARDPEGRIAGYCVPVPLSRHTAPALHADPAAGAFLAWIGPETEVAWTDRTLLLSEFGLSQPAIEGYFVLFREACADLAAYHRIAVITALEEAARFAPLLGGRAVEGFSAMLPGRLRPNRAFVLEVADRGYAAWLERLVQPLAEPGLPPEDRPGACQELLSAARRGKGMDETAAARHFAAVYGTPTPALLRAWLEDGVSEAPLPAGERGRALIRRYYLEGARGHEAVAEELDLSRRQHFRVHREALAALGDWLFG